MHAVNILSSVEDVFERVDDGDATRDMFFFLIFHLCISRAAMNGNGNGDGDDDYYSLLIYALCDANIVKRMERGFVSLKQFRTA